MNDPWKLTGIHRETLAAVIEHHGRRKAAANALGVSHTAVVSRVREAAAKMGAPTRFAALLEWDRWVRAHQETNQ